MALESPHYPLAIVLPFAIVAAAALGAYWWRLGQPDVTPRRRKLRRTANVLLAVLLFTLVVGLSILEPRAQPVAYVVAWLVASLATGGVLALAFADALESLKRIAAEEEADAVKTARRLLEELGHEERDDADHPRD